jgi:2-polyprenyl-6-methoxyphenol hydroxylase-like FAD-dependent oxidoreductase
VKLDPIVRRLAVETPGVTYVGGHVVDELHPGGLAARDRDGRRLRIAARLVVGADGRRSTVARLAGAREASSPNDRFCLFAYYAGVEEPGRVWRGARDVVLAVPNDDGLTVLAVFGHRDDLPGFDRAGGIERTVAALPDAPDLTRARRVSKVLGYREHANLWRDPAPAPGLALIGDAALSLDPVPAIGCGWALQSAGWLADAVAGHGLAAGPAAYARVHERQLGAHRRLIVQGAVAGPPSPELALLLGAATRDADAARLFFAISTRSAPAQDLLTPAALERLRSVAG